MSRTAKIWLGLLVGAAGLIAVLFVLAQDNRPDEVLIKESLEESIKASKEGRAGGVMDFISDQLRIDGLGRITKAQVANLIRDSKPDVQVDTQSIEVQGNKAEMLADATVNANVSMFSMSTNFSRTFTGIKLRFEKEEARKYVIVPVRVWRLVEVNIPGDQVDFGPGF